MSEQKPKRATGPGTTVNTSIAMPVDLHEQIKKKARAQEMSVSAVIRRAMRQSLAASGAPEEADS